MTTTVALGAFTEYSDDFSSDVVEGIYYNSESSTLLVLLYTNPNEVYAYQDVPAEIWTAFKAANSKGRFYNAYVKGAYRSSVISNDDLVNVNAPVVSATASTPAPGSLVVRYRVVREEEVVLQTVQDLADFLSDEGISESDLLSVSLAF